MAFTQKQGLFNDPAPAGKGPSAAAAVDPITANPLSRFGDTFQDASAKLAGAYLPCVEYLIGALIGLISHREGAARTCGGHP